MNTKMLFEKIVGYIMFGGGLLMAVEAMDQGLGVIVGFCVVIMAIGVWLIEVRQEKKIGDEDKGSRKNYWTRR